MARAAGAVKDAKPRFIALGSASHTSQKRFLQGTSPARPQHPPARQRHSATATPCSRSRPRLRSPACKSPVRSGQPQRPAGAVHAGSSSADPPPAARRSAMPVSRRREDVDAIFFLPSPSPTNPAVDPHTPSSQLRGEVVGTSGAAESCSASGHAPAPAEVSARPVPGPAAPLTLLFPDS